MSENEKKGIKITADNFASYFAEKFQNACDFDDEFHRLPMPTTNDSIVDQVIQIDRQYGFIKNKDYDPYKSKTYKLLKAMMKGETVVDGVNLLENKVKAEIAEVNDGKYEPTEEEKNEKKNEEL